MESWGRCLGGCIFSCSWRNCILFFQFPFWYILEYFKFSLCVTAWRRGFVLRLSFYPSKIVSLSSRYGFILYHLELSRIKLPSLFSNNLIEIVTIPLSLGSLQYLSYYHQCIIQIVFDFIHSVFQVLWRKFWSNFRPIAPTWS